MTAERAVRRKEGGGNRENGEMNQDRERPLQEKRVGERERR